MNLSNLTRRTARSTRTTATLVALALVTITMPLSALPHQEPELGDCTHLQPPAGSKIVSHLYAEGVQIYEWNGTSWRFVAPEALLFANAGGTGGVGIHYEGPTWESRSGSKVGGMVIERCTLDPDSIQWLLLVATTKSGPAAASGTVRQT